MKQIPLLLIFIFFCSKVLAGVLPFVKQFKAEESVINIEAFSIRISSAEIKNEAEYLEQSLGDMKLRVNAEGFPIKLELTDPALPVIHSEYQESVKKQGYHLQVSQDGVLIESLSAQGTFYAIQTLLQLISAEGEIPEVEVLDWPDFPMRMIMIDPARQNEQLSYYKRLIRFCGENKINFLQVHLTDHQTSALFHEDYPELMHRNAWSEEDIKELVSYASGFHVSLLPEIESFGHSRMFIRLEDATDYLHQTEMMETVGWTIIDIPGYTSVLCPASDKALHYLDEMYERAGHFKSENIHIGFDEVDMSNCQRCNEKFGNLSQPELFQHHLLQCLDITGDRYSNVGIWGDLLLKYPGILEALPNDKITVYDWNYRPEVDPSSVSLFKEKEFQIIACPALMCYPYIIMPSENNYLNVRNFITLARNQNLAGVNTTIWVPQRYLSDALWHGISFAASQSWGGSAWDEALFHETFFKNYFGSEEGEMFHKTWDRLIRTIAAQDVFAAGCWYDEKRIREAHDIIDKKGEDLGRRMKEMKSIIKDLRDLGKGVTRHKTEWEAIESCAAIQDYVFEHLFAATEIKISGLWNQELLEDLDKKCLPVLDEIEGDWDRNRYPDDINKNGIYQDNEHLLYKFRMMHEYHTKILKEGRTVTLNEN